MSANSVIATGIAPNWYGFVRDLRWLSVNLPGDPQRQHELNYLANQVLRVAKGLPAEGVRHPAPARVPVSSKAVTELTVSTRTVSLGESGESDEVCDGCGDSVSEPHSPLECIERVKRSEEEANSSVIFYLQARVSSLDKIVDVLQMPHDKPDEHVVARAAEVVRELAEWKARSTDYEERWAKLCNLLGVSYGAEPETALGDVRELKAFSK